MDKPRLKNFDMNIDVKRVCPVNHEPPSKFLTAVVYIP